MGVIRARRHRNDVVNSLTDAKIELDDDLGEDV